MSTQCKENYAVTLEAAKQMACYKFSETPLDEVKKCAKNEPSTVHAGVFYVLEFGCIDLEMTMRDDNLIDYYVCTKNDPARYNHTLTQDEKDNGVWESLDCLCLIDVEQYNTVEEVEADMFTRLMAYAEKNNLTWSCWND